MDIELDSNVASLNTSSGEKIPEHDTRLLVKNASNYLPEYTNLVKVIADPNIIDGMLLRAVSGDVVRYTGVRSSVSTTKEKPSILFPTFSKILGTKKVSEVKREDVEGLIWARAAEVDNVAINRKQLCSLEFPTSYHTTLDTFCEVPGIINLLSHPQVSIPTIKSYISLFGKNELSFLSRVFGFKGALVQNTSHPSSLIETLNDADMLQSLDTTTFVRYNSQEAPPDLNEILLYGCGEEIPVKNSGVADFIAQALQQAKALEVGEGVCLGAASSKTLYLVKSDETYSITSVDLAPLIATLGASCKDLICVPKLSVSLSNLAELEKVRMQGFGQVAASFAVVLPGTSNLISAPMGNSAKDLLDANMPKLMTLLDLADIKGSEKEILDDILKSPKNILLIDGIIKLLSLPAEERSVLEDKLLHSRKQRNKQSLKLAQNCIPPQQKIYYVAKELADAAYNIGKSDKRSIGIVIKPASLVKNRHYLKWSDGEFKIVVGGTRPVQHLQSQMALWDKYKPPGYFLPCPPFIAAADLAEIEFLFQMLGKTRKLKQTSQKQTSQKQPSQWLHGVLRAHEQFRPSAVGKLNAENSSNKRSVKTPNGDPGFLGLIGKMSQIYTLSKNQKVLILDASDKADRVYASRDENGIFKVTKFDATPILVTPVATIEPLILDQIPEPVVIAETVGMELTKLIKSGLSLEESIHALTQDTRFKPDGSNLENSSKSNGASRT